MLNLALLWQNNWGYLKEATPLPRLLSSCSLGPYTGPVPPLVLKGAHTPDRPLVWADNANSITPHWRHLPQGTGRVCRMSLPKSLGGNYPQPPPLHCVLDSAMKKSSCFGFAGVCTRISTLGVFLSPLFCLVWILKLLIFTCRFQSSSK